LFFLFCVALFEVFVTFFFFKFKICVFIWVICGLLVFFFFVYVFVCMFWVVCAWSYRRGGQEKKKRKREMKGKSNLKSN
jgi:fatty acid desaturase